MGDNFSQGPESRHMLWFFLCVCSVLYLSVVSNSLWQHGLQSPRLLWPWGFTRQEYWSGLPFPSLRDLPNPGTELHLPHCRWILYCLSHQGSPRILEWVAYPFFRGSYWPRNWIGVLCIARGFFTSWATREALAKCYHWRKLGKVYQGPHCIIS